MKKMYFLMLILGIAMLFGTVITAGGRVQLYLNLPSFVMVAGLTLILLRGSFSFREMGASFRAGFADGGGDDSDIRKGIEFFEAMQRYLLISGLLGTLVGAMAMLQNLETAEKVGFGAALAIMTLLYGLVLIVLVALPFKYGLRKRAKELH
jgi:flagellar motor component MotA